RRMVARYGGPGTTSLGVLGEQGIEQSLTRVQELAAEYEGLVEEPLVPAFEIISTIASSESGDDGIGRRRRLLARARRGNAARMGRRDRKSTRLNSSHVSISYAVFCLKNK